MFSIFYIINSIVLTLRLCKVLLKTIGWSYKFKGFWWDLYQHMGQNVIWITTEAWKIITKNQDASPQKSYPDEQGTFSTHRKSQKEECKYKENFLLIKWYEEPPLHLLKKKNSWRLENLGTAELQKWFGSLDHTVLIVLVNIYVPSLQIITRYPY